MLQLLYNYDVDKKQKNEAIGQLFQKLLRQGNT